MITGNLVKGIQQSSSMEEAIETYKDNVLENGLTEIWLRSVYANKKELPVLNMLFDVQSNGVAVLTLLGIAEDVQTSMWEKWPTLPEDVRASWVDSFADVDQTDMTDLSIFVTLLVKLLS